MESIKGGDLLEQREQKEFSMRETEILIYQVLDALSYIHEFGFIHHDIRPQNILVSTSWSPAMLIRHPNLICLPHSCRGMLSINLDLG